jgi:hypothetical protein
MCQPRQCHKEKCKTNRSNREKQATRSVVQLRRLLASRPAANFRVADKRFSKSPCLSRKALHVRVQQDQQWATNLEPQRRRPLHPALPGPVRHRLDQQAAHRGRAQLPARRKTRGQFRSRGLTSSAHLPQIRVHPRRSAVTFDLSDYPPSIFRSFDFLCDKPAHPTSACTATPHPSTIQVSGHGFSPAAKTQNNGPSLRRRLARSEAERSRSVEGTANFPKLKTTTKRRQRIL